MLPVSQKLRMVAPDSRYKSHGAEEIRRQSCDLFPPLSIFQTTVLIPPLVSNPKFTAEICSLPPPCVLAKLLRHYLDIAINNCLQRLRLDCQHQHGRKILAQKILTDWFWMSMLYAFSSICPLAAGLADQMQADMALYVTWVPVWPGRKRGVKSLLS